MPRPRKARELKLLQGTFRPDRDHEPHPAPGMPDLPEGWADDAPWGEEAVVLSDWPRTSEARATLAALPGRVPSLL